MRASAMHAQLMWCLLWQEKGELLRKFVASGENLQACEAHIEASRTSLFRGRSIKKLVPVKDMASAPWNFSQRLDCKFEVHLMIDCGFLCH